MISLVVAVSENNVIGAKNDVPWYLPEDLKRFKKLTTGQTVLMGRTTYESIIGRIGKPLPNRKNIVISRNPHYKVETGVELFDSIDKAFEVYKDQDIFVIGGGKIFEQTISKADILYVTHVHRKIEGDTYFPKIDPKIWKETEREDRDGYSFVTYSKSS